MGLSLVVIHAEFHLAFPPVWTKPLSRGYQTLATELSAPLLTEAQPIFVLESQATYLAGYGGGMATSLLMADPLLMPQTLLSD